MTTLPWSITTETADVPDGFAELREKVGAEFWRYTLSHFERANGKVTCYFNRVR